MQASPPARMELVDCLRGFALLGLFLVHMVELYELFWAHPAADRISETVFGLFAGKSFALFALCFGLSFWIIMDRAARRGVDFGARFMWRLGLLAVIGLVHGLIYRGDILVVLAPLGLSLLVFDRIKSDRVLVAVATLLFAQPALIIRLLACLAGYEPANYGAQFLDDPNMAVLADGSLLDTIRSNATAGQAVKWWYYLETGRLSEIIGLFLIGLVLGRTGFFAEPRRFIHARRRVFLAAAALFAMVMLSQPVLQQQLASAHAPSMAGQNLSWLLDSWGALAVMTMQAVGFVELYETRAKGVLMHLAPVGRMTLTLYIGQSLVFVPLFYGFGLHLHDKLTPLHSLVIGAVAFAVQLMVARLWLARFVYGPLEWLWRALTYLSLDVPFRRRGRMAQAAA